MRIEAFDNTHRAIAFLAVLSLISTVSLFSYGFGRSNAGLLNRQVDYYVVCPEGQNNCTRYDPSEVKVYYKD